MTRQIKFNHGAPESTATVWEARINDRLFTFRKAHHKGNVFLYSCETKVAGKTSITSFFSEKDMTPEELEALPRFVAFISATRSEVPHR